MFMLFFYTLTAIVIWLGILSLRGGFTFASYVRRDIARPLPNFAPFASVIVPFRGIDQELSQNIAALFSQNYPNYEIISVTDSEKDSSRGVIEGIIADEGGRGVNATVVIAGEAIDSGQKVHNLRAAVSQVDPKTEVLVFVDTDVRPHAGWLSALVAPLADEDIGAATGYRWFVPERGGFASHLRSVWNASIASSLGPRRDKNFCWGGSTAIRRTTFEALQIRERWRGTVSDDFTMTRVLQEAKLPIHFVPACLVPSFDTCSMGELLEFTNRQLKITRVYAPHLWRPVLIGSLLFTFVFFGGLGLVIARASLGLNYAVALAMLLLIFGLGATKSYIRLRAVALPLSNHANLLSQSTLAHLFLWPVASALYLCNALVAAVSRRIEWRGISYELKSSTEAVIIRCK